MNAVSTLYVSFPVNQGELLHWWHVRDGDLLAYGCDNNPLSAARLEILASEDEDFRCIALLPSAQVVVRWHDKIPDITQRQALTAAAIEARQASLQPELCHIVAKASGDDQIATASMGRDILASGLADLQERGLDPDIITPNGWVIVPSGKAVVKANFSFDQVLRGERFITPDETEMRAHWVGSSEVEALAKDTVDQQIAASENLSFINLRSGSFAKRFSLAPTVAQKKLLAWVAVGLLFVTLGIPIVEYFRLHFAAQNADASAIAAVKPVLGSISDPQSAERQLDQKLIAESRGNVVFSVPASALFSAVQKAPGVSIGRFSYRQDGLVAAELSAVRNEEINPALISLQNAGFIITATPRTDATGVAKADITVRAP